MDRKQRQNLINKFGIEFGRRPDHLIRAPGRVNLLGSHVDYNEGWVLPGAIDRSIWLASGGRRDDSVRIEALDLDLRIEIKLSEISSLKDDASRYSLVPNWARFPLGVCWALMKEGHPLRGMNAMFTGDIPIGAGVSSSAAVEIAFIIAWELLSELTLTNREKALIGQRVENQFLGVSSGIMDQYACVHGKANHLILLDCRSIEHTLIPFPRNAVILVADSGVRRELASSEYNLRRKQCQDALSIIQQELPWIKALRDLSPKEFRELSVSLPDVLRMRAEHVVEECARVLEGVRALEKGDLAHFGDVVVRSHISSRFLYEVSIDELNVLAEAAWETPGCFGARLTGAGFGGCVIAIVDRDSYKYVGLAMQEAFRERFKRIPTIFKSTIEDGAAYISKANY